MEVFGKVVLKIEGKGEYENFLDADGKEYEFLNGVALTDGHYCKHYRWARDFSDRKNVDLEGNPVFRHYCAKSNKFGGWAYCCWTGMECFEKGKSAGVKRIRNQIQKKRMFG